MGYYRFGFYFFSWSKSKGSRNIPNWPAKTYEAMQPDDIYPIKKNSTP